MVAAIPVNAMVVVPALIVAGGIVAALVEWFTTSGPDAEDPAKVVTPLTRGPVTEVQARPRRPAHPRSARAISRGSSSGGGRATPGNLVLRRPPYDWSTEHAEVGP